jgi:hypothetical protein
MCRGGTRACFHRLDFQSKNFPYAILIVRKLHLYVNFSIPLCAKWRFFQGSISLMDMRFYWHVPNSPRNKNLKSLSPYLLNKMVFLASKALLYTLSTGKRTFFSTLNLMILQTVWNECVRFGRHIKTYKLVTRSYSWKYKRKPQFCTICLAFKRGCFEVVLDPTWPLMYRG